MPRIYVEDPVVAGMKRQLRRHIDAFRLDTTCRAKPHDCEHDTTGCQLQVGHTGEHRAMTRGLHREVRWIDTTAQEWFR